jgi:ubiquinone/menaquinone biosynthesis C-methylase UbiE
MLNIGPHDLVLEIGSGNRPRARSNVLVDREPLDNTERAGGQPLYIDARPFVVADGLMLPFKDKSFDYVITSHILEHVSDPRRFASELMRVARAGYIETPSELSEKLFGWPFHRWTVRLDGDNLVLRSRKEDSPFGDYFHTQYAADPFFAEFMDSHSDDFFVKYEWRGTISLQIEEDANLAVKFNSRPSLIQTRTLFERASLGIIRFVLKVLLKIARHFRKFH